MSDYYSSSRSLEREGIIAKILGSRILASESMVRLRDISFLGALNFAAAVPEKLRFNRYDHSISVAFLTWNYCQNLRLSDEVSLTATLSALIHDITHSPYSHSIEIYLWRKKGYRQSHSRALLKSKIVKVLKDSFKSLPSLLQKRDLADTLHELSSKEGRENYHPTLVNMFDTPFCADTFDGVNRAWYALSTQQTRARLKSQDFVPLEPLDPMALIRFISSSQSPLMFRAAQPPSPLNPILRFHNLMRSLYEDIIYSDWQLSAMVMLARAVEIAYSDVDKFPFTLKNDHSVLKKINKNPLSQELYLRILDGNYFEGLSKTNRQLYMTVLDKYKAEKRNHKTDVQIMDMIEKIVCEKLSKQPGTVICYIDNHLFWSPQNIHIQKAYAPIGVNPRDLWEITWAPEEGLPTPKPKIEIFYSRT